ncbi:hypothetical protein D9M71_131490 [compost metagenome]
MIGKIVVLGGQQGLDEVRRNVGDTYRRTAHFAELRDQLAVAAVDAQRNLELDPAQRVDRWKAGAKIEIGAAETEQQATEDGNEGPPE